MAMQVPTALVPIAQPAATALVTMAPPAATPGPSCR
jgi:hypothetical protein